MGERSLQAHVEEQKRTLLVLLSKVHIHIDDEDTDSGADLEVFGSGGGEISGTETYNSEEAATLLVKHFGRLKGQWQVGALFLQLDMMTMKVVTVASNVLFVFLVECPAGVRV